MRLSIVQHLLLEYLTVMLQSSDLLKLQTGSAKTTTKLVKNEDDDNEGDNQENSTQTPRREERLSVLVEAILEAGVVSMLHTREGVKAALAVLWICPPKERKTLIRSLHTCVVSTAENEHGHIFLMGILDAVDDTKLLTKTIIKVGIEVGKTWFKLGASLNFSSLFRNYSTTWRMWCAIPMLGKSCSTPWRHEIPGTFHPPSYPRVWLEVMSHPSPRNPWQFGRWSCVHHKLACYRLSCA